jgi:hypothetical protein
MARVLTFAVNGAEYSAAPVKLDRKKLYGWREIVALDDDGRECRMVNMDETGTLVIPNGGLGLGILSPENEWVERSSLKAVNADGSDAQPVPSSFAAPIPLKDTVDCEEFFNHTIEAVYQLDALDATKELAAAVGDRVYAFTYSYRDSYAGSPAFLVAVSEVLFMLVGYRNEYEMLSLEQAGAVDEFEEEDEEEAGDELDFSMGL